MRHAKSSSPPRIAVAGLFVASTVALSWGVCTGQEPAQPRTKHKKPSVQAAELSAKAVDYSKVERVLIKQPAYQTKDPLYALLVFGPELKLRVWVVRDGKEVYIDRNGDGDLTGKDEKLKNYANCRNIELADPDGKTTYVITRTGIFTHPLDPSKTILDVDLDIKGPVAYSQYGMVEMKADPKKAGLAHFDGPLTISAAPPAVVVLKAGEKAVEIRASVSTVAKEYGGGVNVRSHKGDFSTFPNRMVPVVDVVFPPKTLEAEPIKKRFPLDKFMCQGVFFGFVEVPEEAGLGTATLTYSYEAWQGRKVTPTTIIVPVVSSSPK